MKSNISENLLTLRTVNGLSQEEVAERVGVSRQAVAKWERGETVPDIINCAALARLYDVAIDDLINYDQATAGLPIPPKGKHLFGTVTVGEKGQIVIPVKARKIFGINPGDSLIILGDEQQGLALIKTDFFMEMLELFKGGTDK